MTIRYQNKFSDLMAFCLYHYARSPMVIGTYGLGFVLISLIIFGSLPKDDSVLVRAIVFVIMEAIALGFLAVVLATTTVLSMISRRNKTFLTEHTIALSEEAFISETPYARSELKWPIVQKLGRSRSHLFIYLSQHAALVVPRRAFQVAGEWDAFYEFCKRKAQASKGLT